MCSLTIECVLLLYTLCAYTYIYTYIHIRMYTYIHIRMYTHTHIHVYTYVCIHTYVHMYSHTYLHTRKHTNTHIHTHAHTYRQADAAILANRIVGCGASAVSLEAQVTAKEIYFISFFSIFFRRLWGLCRQPRSPGRRKRCM